MNLFRTRLLNGWPLFLMVSLPMCVAMIAAALEADLSQGAGVSEMIGFSVRWAVPFIYLVVVTSALHRLLPGDLSRWLLRNRRYVGFCFAVAMAWQALFIYIMSSVYRDYYFSEVYLLRDELEGSVGYIFLVAMVVTSFAPFRRPLSAAQWKLIHRSGVYFLWAYPFSVYWWNLFYYRTDAAIDYLFYAAGLLAFSARIAAWGKVRWRQEDLVRTRTGALAGSLLILAAVVLALTGGYWQAPVTEWTTSPAWSANLVLWLPFWPFEPFLPLLVAALGTWCWTGTRRLAQAGATSASASL